MLENELAVGSAQVVRKRRDGSAVQVEAAFGVTAGREEQESPPRRTVQLVLADVNILPGSRGQHDHGDREVAFLVLGERSLEIGEPIQSGNSVPTPFERAASSTRLAKAASSAPTPRLQQTTRGAGA